MRYYEGKDEAAQCKDCKYRYHDIQFDDGDSEPGYRWSFCLKFPFKPPLYVKGVTKCEYKEIGESIWTDQQPHETI